jgi:perosamine synthetase
MQIPPIKVVFPGKDIDEILSGIKEVLGSGMVAQGKYVARFEQTWADYVGVRHAIALSSGSAAIEIVMRALGVNGLEVLVPTNTFYATAAGVISAGGRVNLTDTDPATFSVQLDELKRRRTRETAGVVVVHIGGIITPEIDAIRDWCAEQGLWLFEDCAHAHGSEWKGRRAGTFGVAGGYSFFATKVMTTGEGGMIVTDDDALAAEARLIRNHGKPDPWVSYHTRFGSNWRTCELNAILGLSQLGRLSEFIQWRQTIADYYTEGLAGIKGLKPVLPDGRSSWYKYIVLLPLGIDRAAFKRQLKNHGVSLSGEVYELPLHRQPVFQGLVNATYPAADDICARHICLPIYYGMTKAEAQFVIESIKAVLLDSPVQF